MKNVTVFALLTAALVACGQQEAVDIKDHDVTGTISGDWGQDAKVRLALVGGGLPNLVVNKGNLRQNLKLDETTKKYNFGVELNSGGNAVGLYQVVAYNDIDGNGELGLNEQPARNNKFLFYSPSNKDFDGIKITLPKEIGISIEVNLPKMTLKKGWNLFNADQAVTDTNPVALSKITNYDIVK